MMANRNEISNTLQGEMREYRNEIAGLKITLVGIASEMREYRNEIAGQKVTLLGIAAEMTNMHKGIDEMVISLGDDMKENRKEMKEFKDRFDKFEPRLEVRLLSEEFERKSQQQEEFEKQDTQPQTTLGSTVGGFSFSTKPVIKNVEDTKSEVANPITSTNSAVTKPSNPFQTFSFAIPTNTSLVAQQGSALQKNTYPGTGSTTLKMRGTALDQENDYEDDYSLNDDEEDYSLNDDEEDYSLNDDEEDGSLAADGPDRGKYGMPQNPVAQDWAYGNNMEGKSAVAHSPSQLPPRVPVPVQQPPRYIPVPQPTVPVAGQDYFSNLPRQGYGSAVSLGQMHLNAQAAAGPPLSFGQPIPVSLTTNKPTGTASSLSIGLSPQTGLNQATSRSLTGISLATSGTWNNAAASGAFLSLSSSLSPGNGTTITTAASSPSIQTGKPFTAAPSGMVSKPPTKETKPTETSKDIAEKQTPKPVANTKVLGATDGQTPSFSFTPNQKGISFGTLTSNTEPGSGVSVTSAGHQVDQEYEPNVDFKPIVPFPDLVEVKTGEEEELFGERSKLFRHNPETKEWKERGIGEMKILYSKDTNKYRILMRREQVLKLCANHVITKHMTLKPMATSDKAWCWVAPDYSEEKVKTEKLAVKFKTPDIAQKFKQVFEDAVAKLKTQKTPPI